VQSPDKESYKIGEFLHKQFPTHNAGQAAITPCATPQGLMAAQIIRI
jgi:hypothetical protein